MRATRRRRRTPDPLASPAASATVCANCSPNYIPNSEKELLRFLCALRHVEGRPVTDTRRCRSSRFRREDLLTAAGALRSILERETGGGFSLQLHGAVPAGASLPF